MTDYTFRLAKIEEVETIFRLYVGRIDWMDKNGIRQWNATRYLELYPLSYYIRQCELGNLYVMECGENGIISGAVVLFEDDRRWPDTKNIRAYYIHNLVSAPGANGVGARLIAEAETLAKDAGKQAVRLDCAVDNTFLNNYYASKGYMAIERFNEGLYSGVLREKKL